MKDELIKFGTAVLAREKGFNHMKSNCYGDNMCYQLPKGELVNALKGNTVLGYILAPTQSLLQKWLREEHNIYLTIGFGSINQLNKVNGYTYSIFHNRNWVSLDHRDEMESYEAASESGLIKALSLIDNK